MLGYVDALILGIVEGITEFLPISSTGHMILVSKLFEMPNTEFLKTFEISIQIGSILAIIVLYIQILTKDFDLYKKLFVAFLPIAIIGLCLYSLIKTYLFNFVVVSISLIVGGVVLVFIDQLCRHKGSKDTKHVNLSYRQACLIGFFQSISIIPGSSRSAMTIIGGMVCGLSRRQAVEFSFFLAIPTMLAAIGYNLVRNMDALSLDKIALIVFGGCVAFLSAFFTVKLYLKFISKYNFTFFGYYRIALGTIFLIFSYFLR